MKNQKTIAKTATTKANVSTSKTSATTNKKNVVTPSVINLNLSKYAEKLKNVEIKEKKTKDSFYKYPDSFSATDINSDKGKKFRNSLRNKIKKFENNIFVFAKTNQIEKLQSEVKDFNSFYKENYQINDYSLKSISQSNDETKTQSFEMMLSIIKDVNAAK